MSGKNSTTAMIDQATETVETVQTTETVDQPRKKKVIDLGAKVRLTATFHSFRGKSSALLLMGNGFTYGKIPVYVPKSFIPEDFEPGDEFFLPEGVEIIPMVNQDGEIRTATDKNGNTIELKALFVPGMNMAM